MNVYTTHNWKKVNTENSIFYFYIAQSPSTFIIHCVLEQFKIDNTQIFSTQYSPYGRKFATNRQMRLNKSVRIQYSLALQLVIRQSEISEESALISVESFTMEKFK